MNQKLKDVLIWVSSFIGVYSLLSSIVYILVGGYFFTKDKSANTQKTLRYSLYLTLIFIAVGVVLSFFTYLFALFGVNTTVLSKIGYVVEIVKVIVYAIIIGLVVFKKETVIENSKDDTHEQEVIIE